MDTSSSSPSPLQNPTTIPTIRPVNCTAFKRESRRNRKQRKRQEKLQLLLDDWAPLADQPITAAPTATAVSTAEWPSPATNQNCEFNCWNLNPKPSLPALPRPPTSADGLAQENALRLCREFFSTEYGSDDDEEEEAYDDHNSGKIYKFFKGLFDKEDLMVLYRKDSGERGEFYCLVCGGIGEKMGKKFVSLVALVHHANFISKTKRIMAHRAYGRVVCELLGLEIHGFQGVYLDVAASDSLSQDDGDNIQVEVAPEDDGEDDVALMDGVEMKNADAS
ncbi:hypothetical protein KSP40_PGU018619 [Platanthera guangdongensis]|uniref:Uncharacterized protein n=1 Tax=Platanthera guangdongensis TaxID=2320717 RepID=A0ABR2M3P5_9ASPA